MNRIAARRWALAASGGALIAILAACGTSAAATPPPTRSAKPAAAPAPAASSSASRQQVVAACNALAQWESDQTGPASSVPAIEAAASGGTQFGSDLSAWLDMSPSTPPSQVAATNQAVVSDCSAVGVHGLAASVTPVPVSPAPAPSQSAPSQSAPAAPATSQPAASAPAAPAGPSVSQQQALESAQSYLNLGSGFSRAGLIAQLDSPYGGKFSVADATWAADHSGADWNAQAVMSAKGYMQLGGFSRASLIDQLTSPYGGQFTYAQATYAVNQVGL